MKSLEGKKKWYQEEMMTPRVNNLSGRKQLLEKHFFSRGESQRTLWWDRSVSLGLLLFTAKVGMSADFYHTCSKIYKKRLRTQSPTFSSGAGCGSRWIHRWDACCPHGGAVAVGQGAGAWAAALSLLVGRIHPGETRLR